MENMKTASVKIWYIKNGNELQFFRMLMNTRDYNSIEEIKQAARDFWHDYKFDIDEPIYKITVDNY